MSDIESPTKLLEVSSNIPADVKCTVCDKHFMVKPSSMMVKYHNPNASSAWYTTSHKFFSQTVIFPMLIYNAFIIMSRIKCSNCKSLGKFEAVKYGMFDAKNIRESLKG